MFHDFSMKKQTNGTRGRPKTKLRGTGLSSLGLAQFPVENWRYPDRNCKIHSGRLMAASVSQGTDLMMHPMKFDPCKAALDAGSLDPTL